MSLDQECDQSNPDEESGGHVSSQGKERLEGAVLIVGLPCSSTGATPTQVKASPGVREGTPRQVQFSVEEPEQDDDGGG